MYVLNLPYQLSR